jgi:hypothetical protein
MKQILICLILCFGIFELFGQNLADTITFKEGFNATFIQKGKALPPYKLKTITESNEDAYEEMVTANGSYNIAWLLQFTGGGLIGYPIGTAIGGGTPKWYLAGIGAALIVVSIPIYKSYVKHGKNGAKIFNDSLKKTAMINHFDINLGLSSQGLGVKINF